MNKEVTIKKAKPIKRGYFYIIEGILTIGWIVYLMNFYSFYKETYFYVDKRLSLLVQMLSFLNDNWKTIFFYFITSFFLMTATLFTSGLVYLMTKKKQQSMKPILLIIGVNLLCFLPLLLNVCGLIFLILFILAASLVYIIFILSLSGSQKEELDYEEGDIIEVKGPFETEATAQKEAESFLAHWSEKESIILKTEIYIDEKDDKYYTEIFIEAINKE
ncbi:hypothetical protein [Enterococcus rivorum]|uniref:Uncharacterized protein n=1 Tax=Enterococcus rivorum TaxID=762845 RepID=A0A1E5KX52_9ENTE|nr:hypothetical protein [Enterococcus rivorum]MBP2097249.1 hypothetical protein [Enterococcus rivorum]OEH82398.1 hypothetical protein BCR26_02910 [Enterococcus rivorum]